MEVEVRSTESVEKARVRDAQRALRMVEELEQEMLRVRMRLAQVERQVWDMRMDAAAARGRGGR